MLENLEKTPELSIHQPSCHLAGELGVQWTDAISTQCLKKTPCFSCMMHSLSQLSHPME